MTPPSTQLRPGVSQIAGLTSPGIRARLPPDQAGHGLFPTNSFLPLNSILPRIGITRQTVKRLEAIQMVREQRDNGNQELAYHARPFVLCGIPLRRPPADELVHRRQI